MMEAGVYVEGPLKVEGAKIVVEATLEEDQRVEEEFAVAAKGVAVEGVELELEPETTVVGAAVGMKVRRMAKAALQEENLEVVVETLQEEVAIQKVCLKLIPVN